MLKYKITPVILCGGSGSRLWPLSRNSNPKQFLFLFGESSLFQQAIFNSQNLISDNIEIHKTLIVANEDHRFIVLEQLSKFKVDPIEIILEPCSKNTAPALTVSSYAATSNDTDPILVVMPSDQMIKDGEEFKIAVQKAIRLASSGSIVLLGIKPSSPETGFGYIKQESKKGEFSEFNVIEFKEKPDKRTAEKYIKDGNYSWNSGIFILKASLWLKAITEFRSDILEPAKDAFDTRTYDQKFIRLNADYFNKIPNESIDYAVMEKAPNSFSLKVILLSSCWNDLGSWNALWQIEEKDKQGNVIFGDSMALDTNNSLLYSSSRLTVASGVNDMVIVETADSVLVLNRNQTQDVKKVVDQLKLLGREEQNLHRKIYRPWGWFDIIDEGSNFKVKRIQVNPGASLSLQKHLKRAEHWVVVKGLASVICGKEILTLKENESTYIPLGEIHQLSNIGQDILEVIEVQSGEYLGEDDIERFNDVYGRN